MLNIIKNLLGIKPKPVKIPYELYLEIVDLLNANVTNLISNQDNLRLRLKFTPQDTTDFSTLLSNISTIRIKLALTNHILKSLKSHNPHAK